MTQVFTEDPVLDRIRSELRRLYGHRIERIVLFGSRARGDAHEESDYDVAVFLKKMTDRWTELDRLAELCTDILAETGAFIDAKAYEARAYSARTPLMFEIHREGIDL